MARYRRRYRRYRPRRRPYRRRAAPNYRRYMGYAKAGLGAIRTIWRYLNVEKKKFDTSITEGVSDAGSITHLSAIAQGTQNTQRVGNSLKAVYFSINAHILRNSASTLVASILRVIILIDRQQVSDTPPTVAAADTSVLDVSNTNSLLNRRNAGRFSILRDKTYNLNDVSTNARNLKINFSLNHHIKYNGTAATDIQQGGIYLLLLSNEPTNTITFGGLSRISYVDN